MFARSTSRPSLKLLQGPTTYQDLRDHELLLACRHDKSAFNELYRRYVRQVRASLNRLAPDWRDLHDDLIQECFIRIWKSGHTIKNPRAFKSWLERVISHLVCDQLRRRGHTHVVSIDEPMRHEDGSESSARDIADYRHQPDETFARKQTLDEIHAALEFLPQNFKNVIVLREFHGLSYEQIAEQTNTEIGTVKSRIARAKSKMKSHLPPLSCA